MRWHRKLIIFSVFFVIFGLIFYWVFTNILFPSSLSVVHSCYPQEFNKTYSEKYYTAGQLKIGGGSNTTKELDLTNITKEDITIEIYDEDTDNTLIKHELCHLNQFWRNPKGGGFPSLLCQKIIAKYLGEAECYFAQDLPDWAYNKLYNEECLGSN